MLWYPTGNRVVDQIRLTGMSIFSEGIESGSFSIVILRKVCQSVKNDITLLVYSDKGLALVGQHF